MKPATAKAPQPKLTADTFRLENRDYTARMPCTLFPLLQRLPKADVDTIRKAMADPAVESAAITRVLQREFGWTSSRQVVRRHRREGCRRCGLTPLEQ